jgi:hypothetical protein
MSGNKKDEEMICALTADEHAALRTGLKGLAETMPPREVWQRIREQGEAEGLLRPRNVMQRRSTWYAGIGVAAAALVAAIILPGLLRGPVEMTTVPETTGTSSPVPLTTLQTLMRESRDIEYTMATITDLEDRIAAIDYQLNDSSIEMSDEDRELFWRERVRLMKSLLQLRYAQAQRAAF